jgi:carbonic anhydrase
MSYKKLAIATMAALGLQLGACNNETVRSNVDDSKKEQSSTLQDDMDHSKAPDNEKAHALGSAHWSYEGETGPTHWGSLSEEYGLCATGKQQSPIDITESVTADLPPLEFNYGTIPLVIENNGHTIKMTADKAGTLKIGDDEYQLLQFHTHTPSEEAINGEHADMVIHMVHKNAQDQLAVVAVLLDAGDGDTANPLIETLWKVMPKTVGDPQQHDTQIDVNQLLPQDKNYYTFEGSLTTPPCSEGVRWMVLKQRVSISGEQLAQYQSVYHENARPLQAVNDRKLSSSN